MKSVLHCTCTQILPFHVCFATDPTHERAGNNKRYFEDMLIKGGESNSLSDGAERPSLERVVDEYRQSQEFQTYEALCRGENTQVRPLTIVYNQTAIYFIAILFISFTSVLGLLVLFLLFIAVGFFWCLSLFSGE